MSTKNTSYPNWENPIEFHSIQNLQEYIFSHDTVLFLLVNQTKPLAFEYLHSELVKGDLKSFKEILSRYKEATDYAIISKSPEDEFGLKKLRTLQNNFDNHSKPLVFSVPKI